MPSSMPCRLGIAALWLIAIAPALLGAEPAPPSTLAVFGDAVATRPAPAGWRFLWNAKGPLGQADAYQPLGYDESAKSYGVLDEQGKLRPDAPSVNQYVTVKAPADGDQPRCLIASYTLPQDTAGRLWLNHVNVRNASFAAGVHLAVYVNHRLLHERVVARDRMAAVYHFDLGPGKAGDVIDVAIGAVPGSRQGGGKLHFVLQDVPGDQPPPPPVNILTPGLADVVPQLGSDGQILPSYQQMAQRHDAELLARRPQLVFVGDSITTRWPQELLEAHFAAHQPVKLGGAGDWVQNTRWRVQRSALDQAQPALVVVLIGTNNLTHEFTPDEVTRMTGELVSDIRRRSPRSRVLVQGILPRGRSIQEPINSLIKQTNQKLATLADDKDVFFLDVGDVLVEPDGSLSPQVFPDKLHVAQPGYERWVVALKPVVERIMALPTR